MAITEKQLVATKHKADKTNMCTVCFGGWGKQFVMTVDNAMKLLSTFEYAEAYSQEYKDGVTTVKIGGPIPPVEVRILSEQDYVMGVFNYDSEGAI